MNVINWIQMNLGNIIAGAAVAIAAALALRNMWKRRKTGGCGCGCSSSTACGDPSTRGGPSSDGRSPCAGCRNVCPEGSPVNRQ